MNDINDWPENKAADPDCECCLGDGLQADGETPCPCIDARKANFAAQTIPPAPQPEAATPQAAQEAVMRQWPDPLTSDMARALEQHRESLLVEIMSMFDQMQRQLDYSRGGKLGPVDPPQPSETVVEAMKHLQDIINCGNCSGSRQSARLALRALKGDK